MKKILIVDDNANNRMLLSLLLQDYMEREGAQAFEIEECSNGLEAVNKASVTKYDLVFMDIMMPQMDGIEATKKIREHDKDVMIIAVSAVEDEARQKEILRCGAEDYVAKPLDSEQFYARVENYFSLLSRRHALARHTNSKSVNLYTNLVFHRQTIFYVENDEALTEFWEHYLLDEHPINADGLSDVIRAVYTLGDAIIKTSQRPWIIIEADNDAYYFTLNKLESLGEESVKLIMENNKEVEEYKTNSEKISFKLWKTISPFVEELSPVINVDEVEVPEAVVESHDVEVTQSNAPEYEVFEYMDDEDLLDMKEHLGDLSSLMLMLGSSKLKEDDIYLIAALLDALGKSLTVYTQSYHIGKSLLNLSSEIVANIERFKEIEEQLYTLSGAFVSDLQTWARTTFEEGAPSANFLNDTIVANTLTIISMLKEDDVAVNESDVDDIFDF